MWCIFVCLCILFNPKTIKCKNKQCSNVMICNDHDRAVLFCLQLLERRKREKQPTKRHTQNTQHNPTNKPHLPLFFAFVLPHAFFSSVSSSHSFSRPFLYPHSVFLPR